MDTRLVQIDEPNPEYAPQKNKESIVITANPPTKPTSHKGILPVFAIKKAPVDCIKVN